MVSTCFGSAITSNADPYAPVDQGTRLDNQQDALAAQKILPLYSRLHPRSNSFVNKLRPSPRSSHSQPPDQQCQSFHLDLNASGAGSSELLRYHPPMGPMYLGPKNIARIRV
ncbi:hypothetical protein Fot_33476 [Forsythia ovata]|uniref:Uncharacterized protein n=1 Tax=Forsythia ovata TaxID=205694 RepID=A0ABD1TAV8_9LAMI